MVPYGLPVAGAGHQPARQLVRNVEGLTTKVLTECLERNTRFGILERVAYNEVPPRVEYRVTPFGEKFIRILDELDTLQAEIDRGEIA